MSVSIEGIWHSRYEYGKGSQDEPRFSEHQVEFRQGDTVWIGTSVPAEDGSQLTVTLRRTGDEFKGEWYERTSPSGPYQGREYSGVILLQLQESGNELSGMWLGAGSSGRVKSGVWTFTR